MPSPTDLLLRRFRRSALAMLLIAWATLPGSLGLNSVHGQGHRVFPPNQIEQVLHVSVQVPVQAVPDAPTRSPPPTWSNHNRSGDYVRALRWSVIGAAGLEAVWGAYLANAWV